VVVFYEYKSKHISLYIYGRKTNRYELVFDEDNGRCIAVSLVNEQYKQIEALMFSNTEIHNCLSNEEIDPKIIDSIILKGEKIDTSEWELIDEKLLLMKVFMVLI
jgi:hypothetical protein